jgi:hypothetical protein
MVFDREPRRGQGRKIAWARLDLKHPLANQALKMMMMAGACPFITGVFSGQIDRLQFTVF